MPHLVGNPYEENARQKKAYALVVVLESHYRELCDLTDDDNTSISECAAYLSDDAWKIVSELAHVASPPSETTKALVIEILMKREAVHA